MNKRGILLAYDFPPSEGGIQTLMRDFVAAPSGIEWSVVTRRRERSAPETVVCPATRIRLRPQRKLRDRVWLRLHPRASMPDFISYQAGPTLLRLARKHSAKFLFADQLCCATAVRNVAARTGLPWGLWVLGKELLRASEETRVVLSSANVLLACSKFTKDLAVAAGAKDECVFVVHPCIDALRFEPLEDRDGVRRQLGLEECPVLLTVAHLVQRKGHEAILHALAAMRDCGTDVQYLVVGKGPAEGALKELVISLDLSNAVRFCGYVPDADLPAYYGAADLHVMPSLCDGDVEGFGISFIEAAACGTPSIGSDSGGIPDAIVENVTGCLVPPGDAKALANCIQSLLADPASLVSLRRSARQTAIEQFSSSVFAERLTSILGQHMR
jgi:glycosyltransferase involved in cell wall biosynthesis